LERSASIFEAPAAPRLEKERIAFLDWFNANSDLDRVIKAGLAHLWFVSIHPFEDGNGRIARAIAEMVPAALGR
jgi:Fic family protein